MESLQMVSTHTPHAGRDGSLKDIQPDTDVSTHTPHAGRDKEHVKETEKKYGFYSHAPCGT